MLEKTKTPLIQVLWGLVVLLGVVSVVSGFGNAQSEVTNLNTGTTFYPNLLLGILMSIFGLGIAIVGYYGVRGRIRIHNLRWLK